MTTLRSRGVIYTTCVLPRWTGRGPAPPNNEMNRVGVVDDRACQWCGTGLLCGTPGRAGDLVG
jgi:hypothetical protein